jgi:hypothetical protein
MQRAILALALALCVAACDDSPPGTPTPQTVNLTGTWSGDVSVPGASAVMSWVLTHSSDTDVSGPVTISLPNGIVLLNGFLTGTISGSVLTYSISVGPSGIPLSPTCVGQLGGAVTATIGVTSTLAGDFALRSSTCPAPVSNGTITLTKR